MPQHFADRLLDAIDRKGNPICVGIDPMLERLPDAVAGSMEERDSGNLEDCVDCIRDFCRGVLEVVAPLVPIVKFQSAYFEKYLWPGVELYYQLIAEAGELGLLTIGDVKRGDIGATSDAYAQAHLSTLAFDDLDNVATPDAITINPMLGFDSMEPFITSAAEHTKGLFVLVRTSNPGSTTTQDVRLADGRTWSEMIADSLASTAALSIGGAGFSSIGAVVGATQTESMTSLRKRLPHSIFLLPGYGAQGATAEMTRAAFIEGRGAIVSASRSILYPAKTSGQWEQDIAAAVRKMDGELREFIRT